MVPVSNSFIVAGDYCPAGVSIHQQHNAFSPIQKVATEFGRESPIIANLECAVTDAIAPETPKWARLRLYSHQAHLLDGLGLAVLANNHISDFGTEGARNTLNELGTRGIPAVGYGVSVDDALAATYLDLKSARLGVIALCCPTTNGGNLATHSMEGVAPLGMHTLANSIMRSRDGCDALIVYLHWGKEWTHDPVTEQMLIARHAIDWGADAVVGCHAHVIQSFERYRGRPIFYGLGNILFGRGEGRQLLADGRTHRHVLRQDPPNRESIVIQLSIQNKSDCGRLRLERLQPFQFGDDFVPVPVDWKDLSVDLGKCNGRLARRAKRYRRRLAAEAELCFLAYLPHTVLTYEYASLTRNEQVFSFVNPCKRGRRLRPIRRLRFLLRLMGFNVRRHFPLAFTALMRIADAILWPFDWATIREQYRSVFNRNPKLRAPVTFNEKLQRAKLFHRKAIHIVWADKIAMRSYVASRVGERYLPQLYWTGTDLRTVDLDSLPEQFVIKANHGSGMNLFVRNRSRIDWEEARKQSLTWLKHDYSTSLGEWQYRWVTPCLLIEEFLQCSDGNPPLDYKFFCFHGTVRFIQADVGRFKRHSRALFNRQFQMLPLGLHYPRCQTDIVAPNYLSEMIELAETLAGSEPFVRVDCYETYQIFVGELTLHPGAGLERFDPPSWDVEFGRYL